ncbi:hypothetical protein TPELB_23650 [Terrisporobacter petrolearius]|uniref:DUF2187 domain-containing protein n=1 Tax=Terrisporobacter petrolearius TaxID=1460447 RepID=A0ABZ3FH69_9FIRM
MIKAGDRILIKLYSKEIVGEVLEVYECVDTTFNYSKEYSTLRYLVDYKDDRLNHSVIHKKDIIGIVKPVGVEG